MRVLSLFSGCGGMDIGFEGGFKCHKKSININMHPNWIEKIDGEWVYLKKTSFDTIFANDIRADAKAAWQSYFSGRKGNVADIYHLESIVDLVKRSQSGEKIFPDNIDVVTGGFPCQDFSVSGKRQGFKSNKSHLGKKIESGISAFENRGQLYIWMKEVICITKPKLFIAENVKGLTNLSDAKEIIEEDFSAACDGGYLVIPAKVLNAADYGVPQSRERVIFFGFKKSALKKKAYEELTKQNISEIYDPYPLPTHSFTKEAPNLESPVTCQDILNDLSEPNLSEDASQMKYSRAKYMGSHCQGQNEIKLNSVAPTIRSEHHGNIEYRRLSLEHGGTHFEELSNGLAERRLTVRECARIQTFPDDYQFIHSANDIFGKVTSSDAYKIIGNAVPCVLAYNIAMRIEKNWSLYFKQ